MKLVVSRYLRPRSLKLLSLSATCRRASWGNHIRLTTNEHGTHPCHDTKPLSSCPGWGTLAAILDDVASHHTLEMEVLSPVTITPFDSNTNRSPR